MHSNISQALASEHIADTVRAAEQHRRAAGIERGHDSFVRRAYSRYFGSAHEGHVESVRRSGRRARGAGARLT